MKRTQKKLKKTLKNLKFFKNIKNLSAKGEYETNNF